MDLKLNSSRFTGQKYVSLYDKFRPTPPIEIIHQTLNYLNKNKANVIVDLGCGTGISTAVWSSYAEKVIGVEPSEAMIQIAKTKIKKYDNVTYLVGYSDAIDLPSQSADIITCSQSFHWMEPQSTLKEINRVLKDNGVLVIYDVIWPPSVNYEYEKAYNKLFLTVDKLTSQLDTKISHRWNKKEHLSNINAENYFKFLKETYFHKTEKLSTEQFIGIALSQGGLEALLKRGFTDKEIGVDKFKNAIFKTENLPYNEITYNYRVIYGIK